MPKNQKEGLRSPYVLAVLAVLIAVQIVMTRFLVIDLGFARFSIGSIASITAGLWFGPAAGGLVGGISDLIGSFIKGYAPNPLIWVSAVLWGVLPALLVRLSSGWRLPAAVKLAFSVIITSIVCTMGFTYAGLVLFLGYDFRAILVTRLIQLLVMTPVICVLVFCLYNSPVTSFLRGTMHMPLAKMPHRASAK